MSNITAALVKELRERTNAGMMECKKALVEANGDIEKAIELMRTSGQARAVKKAGRVATEGTIVILVAKDGKRAVIVEVNSETDFVSREARFKAFAREAADTALNQNIKSLDALKTQMEGKRLDLVSALGENVSIRRLSVIELKEGMIGSYEHGDANGIRIGVIVSLKKGSAELAKDLAMHIAAMNPEYIAEKDIPADRLQKEKEIFIEQTREEGKPEAMFEKIVAGKLKKFAQEVTLLGQAFVKDPNKKMEALLKEMNAEMDAFVRFEVGEGIEKKQDNFAEEVRALSSGE